MYIDPSTYYSPYTTDPQSQAQGSADALARNFALINPVFNDSVSSLALSQSADERLTRVDIALLLGQLNLSTQVHLTTSFQQVMQSIQYEIKEKQAERIEKIFEAIEKQNSAKKAGVANEIFGWITLALANASALLTCNPALILAAVALTIVQIDGQHLDNKIMDQLAGLLQEISGDKLSDEHAMLGANIFVGVIVMALSILGTAQISAAARKAANDATNLGKLGAKPGTPAFDAPALVQDIQALKFNTQVRTFFAFSQLIFASSEIGGEVAQMQVAYKEKEVADAQEAAKNMEALIQKYEFSWQEATDLFSQVTTDFSKLQENVASIIESAFASDSRIINTI